MKTKDHQTLNQVRERIHRLKLSSSRAMKRTERYQDFFKGYVKALKDVQRFIVKTKSGDRL